MPRRSTGTWAGPRTTRRNEGIDLLKEQERARNRVAFVHLGETMIGPTITRGEMRDAIATACQNRTPDQTNLYDIAADAALNLIADKLSNQ